MELIKIFLVDDHTLFRDGIKSILDEEKDIVVTDEAADGETLFKKLQVQIPDIVITDIGLPDISGIEITERLTKQYPELKILVLSMHNNEEFILSSLRAGANGYLSKDIKRAELIEAIHSVMEGKIYFNKEISQTIIQNYRVNDSQQKNPKTHAELTERETEVLKLVGEGLINKEIAGKLFISIRTVDAHKNHIMHKLELKSTVDMVKYAIKSKLVDL